MDKHILFFADGNKITTVRENQQFFLFNRKTNSQNSCETLSSQGSLFCMRATFDYVLEIFRPRSRSNEIFSRQFEWKTNLHNSVGALSVKRCTVYFTGKTQISIWNYSLLTLLELKLTNRRSIRKEEYFSATQLEINSQNCIDTLSLNRSAVFFEYQVRIPIWNLFIIDLFKTSIWKAVSKLSNIFQTMLFSWYSFVFFGKINRKHSKKYVKMSNSICWYGSWLTMFIKGKITRIVGLVTCRKRLKDEQKFSHFSSVRDRK